MANFARGSGPWIKKFVAARAIVGHSNGIGSRNNLSTAVATVSTVGAPSRSHEIVSASANPIISVKPSFALDGSTSMALATVQSSGSSCEAVQLLVPRFDTPDTSATRVLLPFDFNPDFAGLSIELRVQLRREVDELVASNPDATFKFGSCYVRRLGTRTNDQAQYSRQYFDNASAQRIGPDFTDDATGAAAEGYIIEYAKHLYVSVNVRRVGPGSLPRNPKRGDKGFSRVDPGCLYAVRTNFTSVDVFFRNHVSYYLQKMNYSSEQVDVNGRKFHTNSVTGLPGALTYKDGRRRHRTRRKQALE